MNKEVEYILKTSINRSNAVVEKEMEIDGYTPSLQDDYSHNYEESKDTPSPDETAEKASGQERKEHGEKPRIVLLAPPVERRD